MYPTSALCRAQETLHRKRAAGTALGNVRNVAMEAATAWGREALVAERREARYERNNASPQNSEPKASHFSEEENRSMSENPDRDFADAPANSGL